MNLRRYAADMHDRAQVLRADAMEAAAHDSARSGQLHRAAQTAEDTAYSLDAVILLVDSMSATDLDARLDAVLRAAGGSLDEHAGSCDRLRAMRDAMRRAILGEVHQ